MSIRTAGTARRIRRVSGGGAGAVGQALGDVASIVGGRLRFGGGLFRARASAVHELPHAWHDLLVQELRPLFRRVRRRGARHGGDDRHQHLLEQPAADAPALAQIRLHIHLRVLLSDRQSSSPRERSSLPTAAAAASAAAAAAPFATVFIDPGSTSSSTPSIAPFVISSAPFSWSSGKPPSSVWFRSRRLTASAKRR